jgi:hypothetical protein
MPSTVGEISCNEPLSTGICRVLATTMNGTGFVVCAVSGRRWRVRHLLGVAMIGGDEHGSATARTAL